MESKIKAEVFYVLESVYSWFRRRWALSLLYVPVFILLVLGRNTTRPIFYVDAAAMLAVGIVVTDPYRLISRQFSPEMRTYFCVLESIIVTAWNLPLNWVAELFITAAGSSIMLLATTRNRDWLEQSQVLMSPDIVKATHALQYGDHCDARDDWERRGSLEVRTIMRVTFKSTISDSAVTKFFFLSYMVGHIHGTRRMESLLQREKRNVADLEFSVAGYREKVRELLEELNQNGDAAQQLEYKVAEISRLNGVIRKLNAQLEELTEAESRDHKILRLKAEGKTGAEIAAACGCSTGTVSNVVKKYKSELEEAS